MYQAKIRTKKGFVAKASTLDFTYIMDKEKELGTTPGGHLVMALAGCVTMCVRGYYIKKERSDSVYIETDITFEKEFKLTVNIDREVLEDEKPAILEHIEKYCVVSQLLRKDVVIDIEINGK